MKISSWVTTRLLVPKPFSRIGCEPWRAPSALPAPPSERRSPAPGRRSPPPGPSAGWSYSACAASGTRRWHPADGPVETRLKKYQQQGGRERNNITESFPKVSCLTFSLDCRRSWWMLCTCVCSRSFSCLSSCWSCSISRDSSSLYRFLL